ncbi:MAG: response regulator [Paludibacter sp.]|nr:response regulator [Paludibacter sp.]
MGQNITNIYEDKSGKIWISSWKSGLCIIDQKSHKIKHFPKIGINNNPFRVYQDKDGLFWICTWGDGIYNATVDNNLNISIRKIQLERGSEKKIDDIVYSIVQDDKLGFMWVVTYKGLTALKKQSDGTCKLLETENMFDKNEIRLFHEIAKDRKGNLWLGTIGKGLYTVDFKKNTVQNFALDNIKTLVNTPSLNVSHMCATNTNIVNIAISRIGLFNLDISTGKVFQPKDNVLRNITNISALARIKSKDELWLTDEGKDYIYIFKNNGLNNLSFSRAFTLNNTGHTEESKITVLFEDKKNCVWIGTADGLYYKPLNANVKLLSKNYRFINCINEDPYKNIFVGTEKDGLFIFKLIGNKYIISKVPLKTKNYQSYSIQSVCCCKDGSVYIGTKEGCIYLYDKVNNSAVEISAEYGIADNGIFNIIEDNNGYIWISSIKKIIRFNPKTHAATYFSTADGMIVNSFYKDASTKLNSGLILFGGNNGICAFNPSNLNKISKVTNTVSFSDIFVQSNSIFNDKQNKHFDLETNKVTLKYSENNLGIEFSNLDYTTSSKVQYAYMLTGFDNSWNYVGNNRRYVNYSNLPEGSYVFKVKASDEHGNWRNQVTSLNVSILPPFYKTWWADLIYLIILGFSASFFGRNILKRIRLSNELKISKIENEKSEELAQIKLRYFTNISHELLTPLTIIMLQIERLQQKIAGENVQFEIMKDNVLRLKRLIQQILVFRKTESGNMKLKVQKEDIVNFVNNICQSNFNPLITEKKINFILELEEIESETYFDPDKLDKAIYNLLSNAFKYTPIGGTIILKMSFSVRDTTDILRLSVSDSGNGIADDDLPNIFKRFYISKFADQSQSNGIGLALTLDLLQIHKGKISVKSQIGEGSVFTIEIPVSRNAYDENEIATEYPETKTLPDINDIILLNTQNSDDIFSDEDKDNTILVVEDNKELNSLIVDIFSNKCHVLSAYNGLQALEILKNNDINLIICDVMMPEMDGLTFCKIIKNDIETSHIDVLILTAKNSNEDRIDCYNAGADAYIAKPFELSVLKARIKNILKKKTQKKENFKNNYEVNISTMEYNSIDEVFLKMAVNKVENMLSDELFDFDQFAIDMATSKSTLHRKLKSLTGLSPGEFIRKVRMKHAIEMLANNMGNISEIAFAVGFNDPKYFSRCFKIDFGFTPKEYLKNIKSQKDID